MVQGLKYSGGAQENTGIEAIEVSQSLADITDLPVFHLDTGDILHIDEWIVGVSVHPEHDLPIGQCMRCQCANHMRIEEVIRHEQQKRLVQNVSRLKYGETISFFPVVIHQRRNPNRETFRQPFQKITD